MLVHISNLAQKRPSVLEMRSKDEKNEMSDMGSGMLHATLYVGEGKAREALCIRSQLEGCCTACDRTLNRLDSCHVVGKRQWMPQRHGGVASNAIVNLLFWAKLVLIGKTVWNSFCTNP